MNQQYQEIVIAPPIRASVFYHRIGYGVATKNLLNPPIEFNCCDSE